MEEGTPFAESEVMSIDQIVDQRVSQRNAPPEAASETADPPAEAIAEAEAPEAEEVEYEAAEPDEEESQVEYETETDEGEEVEFDLYEQTGIIKVNGEEREMTVREAFDQVQKGEAADQKFQEAAEIRKQYEARNAQLEQTENEYRQGIDAIAKQTAQQGQQQFGYKDQAIGTPYAKQILTSGTLRNTSYAIGKISKQSSSKSKPACTSNKRCARKRDCWNAFPNGKTQQ